MQTLASTSFIASMSALFLALMAALVGGMVVAFMAYLLLQWFKHRRREQYSLDTVMLRVLLPKDNEVKIEAAEQMFNALHSIKQNAWKGLLSPEDHLALEIVGLKESISFNVLCPKKLQDLVEKQIHATYPGARIKEIDEPNIFSEGGKVAFASLKLKNGDARPLKTYRDLPTDPLNLITAAFSKIQDGEGAILQVLLEPASDSWRDKAQSYVRKEREAETGTDGKPKKVIDHKALEAISTKTKKWASACLCG
jgi:hypothetical protein